MRDDAFTYVMRVYRRRYIRTIKKRRKILRICNNIGAFYGNKMCQFVCTILPYPHCKGSGEKRMKRNGLCAMWQLCYDIYLGNCPKNARYIDRSR